jgi:glutaminyl-tRNA synthetase
MSENKPDGAPDAAGPNAPPETATTQSNFVRDIILDDLKTGKYGGRVHTRFPPEPNGYLHIGHAKSICLNFGLAAEFGGKTNLRFDDTNPEKEETEYVDSIMENVRWLGFQWEGKPLYASDYFQQLYDWAVQLIQEGKAYVCDLTGDEVRHYRGTLTEPGKESPYRNRSVGENLDLFERMHAGEFPDGSRTLRAKIDMAAKNLNLRDPIMYRIRAPPHRQSVVHLPDVRFRARPVGFHRGNHPLHLHPRVRRPPAALRVVRGSAGDLSSAADRVRPAQPDLHAT